MIRQWVYFTEWDWTMVACFDVTSDDAGAVLKLLKTAGCSYEVFLRAKQNLLHEGLNTGLTYSNKDKRVSIMVVKEASDSAQFWNTLDHEKGHVATHIGAALGIDCRGEEQEYIAGEIAQELYPIAREYIH